MTYSIEDIISSNDRYKLYILTCPPGDLIKNIEFLKSKDIAEINVGRELAGYINGLENNRYLNIEVYEHVKKLLDRKKSKINNTGNELVAVYNLGILME